MLNIELITDALRDLGVMDAFKDAPEPEDAVLVLRRLNALMLDLEDDPGGSFGYFAQTDPNDELPLTDTDAAAIRPILAMALTVNFPSAQIPQTLPAMAANNMARLTRKAVLANAQEARLDNLPRGSGQSYRGNILTGE